MPQTSSLQRHCVLAGEILGDLRDVRFTPKNGHRETLLGYLLCANSRYWSLFNHLVGTGD